MTTQEIRELFIREHRRDRRLTFINYAIICFGIILLGGVFFFLMSVTGSSISGIFSNAFSGGEHEPWYVKYIFAAVIIGCILYPFYQIWRMSKRPQEIDKLLAKVKAGGKATTVQDYKEYKITLPLLKVNLKLCPVTFVMIYLDNDVKPYKLPINSLYIPDMKIVLSGGNMEKLNEIRDALYGDDEETEAPEIIDKAPTPLKSVEEFRVFLDENLKETVEEIDKQRKKTKSMTMIVVPIVILAVIGIAGYFYYSNYKATAGGDYSGTAGMNMIIPFFVAILVIGFGYSYYMRWKHKNSQYSQPIVDAGAMSMGGTAFNEHIFGKIIKFINPTVEYMPMGHVGLPEFLENGLFQEKNYGIRGNDQISGRHNSVPFIMCELWVSYKRNFSDEKDSDDNVFSGQFFVAKFNKSFSSPVYIKPRKGGLKGIFWNDNVDGYTYNPGEKIKLEDPEFMEMFNVYGTDQIEARYILTPALMERIKSIVKRTKGQFYIAFNNNKITVLNHSNNSKFGTGGYYSSIGKDDNKLLVDFFENISDQFAIIDNLKLNVKIWK